MNSCLGTHEETESVSAPETAGRHTASGRSWANSTVPRGGHRMTTRFVRSLAASGSAASTEAQPVQTARPSDVHELREGPRRRWHSDGFLVWAARSARTKVLAHARGHPTARSVSCVSVIGLFPGVYCEHLRQFHA